MDSSPGSGKGQAEPSKNADTITDTLQKPVNNPTETARAVPEISPKPSNSPSDPVHEHSILFEYFLHEDDVYNHRFQSFIGLQTILFAVYGLVFSADQKQVGATVLSPGLVTSYVSLYLVPLGIPLLGLLLSIVWWYTQNRQAFVFKHLRNELKLKLPELNRIIASRNSNSRLSLSAFTVMNFVPVLFLAFWMLTFVAIVAKETPKSTSDTPLSSMQSSHKSTFNVGKIKFSNANSDEGHAPITPFILAPKRIPAH